MAKKIKEVQTKEQEELLDFSKATNYLKKVDKGYYVVLGIILIFLVACAFSFIYMKSSNNFTYNGVDFNKNQQGSIVFYTAKMPVFDSTGTQVGVSSIDFRTNPRDLKDIPFNFQQIAFIKNKKVYISYENTNNTYKNGAIAGANLGIFLKQMGLDPKAAMNDVEFLNNTALPYVNCQTNPNNTVILMQESSKTEITQTSLNCYEINYTSSDIVKAAERFELTILEQYMTNFKKA